LTIVGVTPPGFFGFELGEAHGSLKSAQGRDASTQAPIKAVIRATLCLGALRLGAQAQPATMTIRVKVPSNAPAGDTI
jgi:hypothetical protein